MDITVKPADSTYLSEYTQLLQHVYESVYTNNGLGLTKECFSKEVFNTKNTQNYLKSNLVNSPAQKAWLAFYGDELTGSITIQEKGNECEIRGFYVAVKYQRKGIGKLLFNKAREFAGNKDIILDIYAHNKKTIDIYQKWGFEIDEKKGVFYRHWPEWPKGLKAKSIYLRLKGIGRKINDRKTVFVTKKGPDLTEDELQQLKTALYREFHVPLPPEKQLADTIFFFLKENGEILSMGGLLKSEPVIFDNKTFTVYGVVNVIANIKGKGYGKMVMSEIKDYLTKHDLTAIGFCKPENAGFYAKCGFDIESHSTQRFICLMDGKRIANSDGQIIFYQDSSASFMRKVLLNLRSEVFLPAPNLW